MPNDYDNIKTLFKRALKFSKKRNYSIKHFLRYKGKIEKYRSEHKQKLKKSVDKLYAMFNYNLIKEELGFYQKIFRIANAYISNNNDRKLLQIDKIYLDDIEKRNEMLRMAYENLIDRIENHIFDQDGIDLGIQQFINDAEDISYHDKLTSDISMKVKETEEYAQARKFDIKRKVTALVGAVVIGFAVYATDISASKGIQFGGSSAYAETTTSQKMAAFDEIRSQYDWDLVYDKDTVPEYSKRVYHMKIEKEKFIKIFLEDKEFQKTFKDKGKMIQYIKKICDGNINNDELKFVSLNKKNGNIGFKVFTNKNGINDGVYYVTTSVGKIGLNVLSKYIKL